MGHALDELYKTIINRKALGSEISYTAKLLESGTAAIAQKVGEESIETVIEAVSGSKEKVIGESVDLLYHLMVLWVDAGIDPQDIWKEFGRRSALSGIEEKSSRSKIGNF